MWNPIPFDTIYFCANCEDEVSGLPAGSRVYSGRPLCMRCTQIGLEEGWAQSQEQSSPDKRIYTTTSKPGIIVIAFFIAVLSLVIWAALTMLKRQTN